MHSQFILASVKLEITDRERRAKHGRHAIDCPQTPMWRTARRLVALRRRAHERTLAIAATSSDTVLAADQNPSV